MILKYSKKRYLTSIEKDGKVIELLLDTEDRDKKKWKGCTVNVHSIDLPIIYTTDSVFNFNIERRLLCIETGCVYSTLKECSERTGVNRTRLAAAIAKEESINGYTYIYVR